MLNVSGVLFRMSTFIFILTSVKIVNGDIKRESALYGEEKQLNFIYPCNSSKVTLQHDLALPFYNSAIKKSQPLPENHNIVVHNDNRSDNCSITMLFTPVLKYDKGTYILIVYAGDGNYLQNTRVALRVDYPPGKASCKWGAENVADDWRSLECSAQPGSLPGEIICYQNEIRVRPPVVGPMEGENSLEKTMRVRYSQPVFCCAVVMGQLVDRCKCKDYTWGPFSSRTDPCPVDMVTTHQEASTSSPSPLSISTKEVTQKTRKNHSLKNNVVLHVPYSCVIGILVIIIFLYIARRVSNRQAYPVKKFGKITYSRPNDELVNKNGKSLKII